ncbi:MAG TPA: hypothetical protein PLZ57_02880 [Pseudobdellovibrionaceae bacterium]|nr:hypothetical protein [Pseudobdellovibrionaceae bacterium]
MKFGNSILGRGPKALALGATLMWLGGCTHALHMVHEGDLSPSAKLGEARRVMAEGEQRVVMGFVGQTDYVDQARAKLEAQCRGGQITGIQSRYSTSHGFLSWTNRVRFQAYCVE